MDKKVNGTLQIVFVITIILVVLYISQDIEALATYGYLGVFVIALLSTATIIFPSPGWAAVIAMSLYLDPIPLGIVAGIGAAIGELTGYIAGGGARDILNDKIKESKKIEKFVEKYDTIAIFVLSFIPNPLFDIAGMIAGGLKIPWWKFLIACAFGRILRYTLIALIGAFTISLLV
ncbi:VTT domain-containing protein [Candidatus Micrarchaeota archaeon]|nr:VTT domain-containing protein [Candidatus Micrarchaeota archaeon]